MQKRDRETDRLIDIHTDTQAYKENDTRTHT